MYTQMFNQRDFQAWHNYVIYLISQLILRCDKCMRVLCNYVNFLIASRNHATEIRVGDILDIWSFKLMQLRFWCPNDVNYLKR